MSDEPESLRDLAWAAWVNHNGADITAPIFTFTEEPWLAVRRRGLRYRYEVHYSEWPPLTGTYWRRAQAESEGASTLDRARAALGLPPLANDGAHPV